MDKDANNIVAKVEDGQLVIRVDLNKNLGKSSTGKSTMIATSRGYAAVPVDGKNVSLSLNVIQR